MVTLTEVEDEHFQDHAAQVEDDDDYSDTGTYNRCDATHERRR